MLSMVFRCISLKTLRFPTSGAFAMCILAYLIPLSMVVSIRDIEITSNFTINSNYTLWQLDNLDKYRTVVGTSVAQALTVQSMIPVFTLFPASLIFLSTQFHVIETTKFGYIIISLLSLSPTIDPLVTIYYVQPYRKYIVDLLWFEERPLISPFLSNNDPRFYRSRSNSVLMMRNTHFV
ncbi:hypothetical protein CAEBREN_31037 [Caenorhabditis brenneri]|uniref:G protein-coupled receptor n=1 Tax=Caenorhabditis brenneri TaxID=135651 RepID=G0MTS3_CAEBE|nr:hypothetical protein CAEBREN_31037 [Caenorhabditis brenneri]